MAKTFAKSWCMVSETAVSWQDWSQTGLSLGLTALVLVVVLVLYFVIHYTTAASRRKVFIFALCIR